MDKCEKKGLEAQNMCGKENEREGRRAHMGEFEQKGYTRGGMSGKGITHEGMWVEQGAGRGVQHGGM